MVRRNIKLCVALLTVVALLGGMLAVIPAIAADTVTETILEDFEDAAHVSNWYQGIAGATMTQNTTETYAGNASGRFENSRDSGFTGDGKNTDVVNFDLSKYEKMRLYVKNPGDTDVSLIFYIYLPNYQSIGGHFRAYLEVKAHTDFTAYEFALADMVLETDLTTKMETQAKENWKILEYGLIPATVGLHTLYVDNITAVSPVGTKPEEPEEPGKSVETILEDFEDAAHVSNWYQGIAGATMTQNTTETYAGNASGRFENSRDSGFTGDGKNTDVVNFDLSKYEKMRLYVKNPGDTDVSLIFYIYLPNYQSIGGHFRAYLEVKAHTDFTAYEFALADMVLETDLTTKMETQAKENWKILEYGLIPATVGLHTLYVDNITAVSPVGTEPEEPDIPDEPDPYDRTGQTTDVSLYQEIAEGGYNMFYLTFNNAGEDFAPEAIGVFNGLQYYGNTSVWTEGINKEKFLRSIQELLTIQVGFGNAENIAYGFAWNLCLMQDKEHGTLLRFHYTLDDERLRNWPDLDITVEFKEGFTLPNGMSVNPVKLQRKASPLGAGEWKPADEEDPYTAAAVAAAITTLPSPKKGDTVLTFPLVPENFQIGIKSSSEPTVIALDGSIRAQADDTDVTLVFTVTDAQGNTADTGNITVTVPGTVEKYPHEGQTTNVSVYAEYPESGYNLLLFTFNNAGQTFSGEETGVFDGLQYLENTAIWTPAIKKERFHRSISELLTIQVGDGEAKTISEWNWDWHLTLMQDEKNGTILRMHYVGGDPALKDWPSQTISVGFLEGFTLPDGMTVNFMEFKREPAELGSGVWKVVKGNIPPSFIAKDIKMASVPEVKVDQTKLVYPKVPEGYTIALKYSSNPEILALDGTITPPGKDRYVGVIFTITCLADGSTADTGSLSIAIPKSSKAPAPSTNPSTPATTGGGKKEPDSQGPSTGVGAEGSLAGGALVLLSGALILMSKKRKH